jgi:DNA polymerase-3 subunit alpha
VRDVGRTLGLEPSELDRLAKLIPNAPNYSLTVAEAADKIPELRAAAEADPRVQRLLEYAQVLEGLSRHASVHAAGVVIAPGPLDEYVPVCTQSTRGAGAGADGAEESVIVTQWDMVALEQAGMLKMDFLGLKTLTVIRDAVEWVRRRHGELRHPDTGVVYERIEDVPLDDAAVYDMLARGATTGVFQFESSLATDKLRAMRCDRFEDLVATNALIRPGPLDSGMTDVYIRRKLGREKVRYPHPALEDVLASTWGVITYQEQVMRVAQVLAGFTLAEADVLRKAVGKKDAELIQQEVARFVERAVARGVSARVADEIADQVVTFGRYGFPRAHSVTYAWLSYQTAWLKRQYPAEFMAALLSSVVDKTDDVVHYISECRELGRFLPGRPGGIQVLPPDVNESDWKFTPVADDQIRFGLGALRGLGAAAVDSILETRRQGGPFRSLFDLAERVDLRVVGKRSLEALVLAGAFDSVGHRAQLMAGLEMVMREAQLRQEERASGQASLFDVRVETGTVRRPDPLLPEVPRWTESERLAREKEILGFFISGHPLERYRDIVRVYEPVSTATLKQFRDQKIELPCVVTGISRQISKRNGSEWGRITVEDFSGTATVLAFGDVWDGYHDLLSQDAPVLIRGTVSGRDRDEDAPPIFLDGVVPLASVRTNGTLALEVVLRPDTGDDALSAALAALRSHPGGAPVVVVWDARSNSSEPDAAAPVAGGNGARNGSAAAKTAGAAVRFRSRSLQVAASDALLAELRSVLGAEHIRLVRA